MKKVYLIMKDGEKFYHIGSLESFMIDKEEFQPYTNGKRRALAGTLKRGTPYKGYQVISYSYENSKIEEIASIDETAENTTLEKTGDNDDIARKIMDLYCNRRLTINKTAVTLGMEKKEVRRIMKEYEITKDSVPFINKDIDELQTDEMVEEVRNKKKLAFVLKLDEAKHNDQEKEIKKHNKKDYYFDKFTNEMKDVKDIRVDINLNIGKKVEKSELEMIATLTDMHFGTVSKSIFNEFNKDVAKRRMEQFTNEIIKYAKERNVNKVHIEQLGDIISGIIHVSNRIKTDMDVVESSMMASKEIAKMLIRVRLETGVDVEFTSVAGNHDRILEGKTESLEEENFERFIFWGIKHIVTISRVKGITFKENKIFNLSLIDMFDYTIGSHHGHNIKNQTNMIETLNNNGMKIKEVHTGHFHRLQVTKSNNITFITSPSFIGADSYSTKMMLVSSPEQLIHIYNEEGRIETIFIKLK